MKVIVTPRAEADILHQHAWGEQRFGATVANRTFDHVRRHLEVALATHPRTGKRLGSSGLYESWIPRTPFVIFYRIDDLSDTVWVLALFHHAQDRGSFDPDDEA